MIMTSADGLTVWYAHMYMPLEFTICPLMDCSLWLVIASAPVLCHRFIIFEFREQQVWVTIFSTISCGGARLFYAAPFFFFVAFDSILSFLLSQSYLLKYEFLNICHCSAYFPDMSTHILSSLAVYSITWFRVLATHLCVGHLFPAGRLCWRGCCVLPGSACWIDRGVLVAVVTKVSYGRSW